MRAGFGFVALHARITYQRYFDRVEHRVSLVVFEFEEFTVEVRAVLRRRNRDEARRLHLQQRRDNFVEDVHAHEGGFFEVQDVSADSAEGFRVGRVAVDRPAHAARGILRGFVYEHFLVEFDQFQAA